MWSARIKTSCCGCANLTGDDRADNDEDVILEGNDADMPSEDDEEDGAASGREPAAPQSKHERRQAALAARIAALEAANMAEKDWFMRGEAKAGASSPVASCTLWRRTSPATPSAEVPSRVRRRQA